jgi:hypothetical protein
LEPGWRARRVENFHAILAGKPEPEDLVADQWTDIFHNLTGVAAKIASEKLGRPVSREEKAKLTELGDMRKMETLRARVDELVADPAVAASLKPWYSYFCKRPGFSDSYLQTFNRPNVTLVDTGGAGVERISPTGVVANGTEYELDCIILSTGFEQNDDYLKRNCFDFVGRGGQKLSGAWSDGPHTMHGLMVAGFPNFFLNGFIQNAQPVSNTYAFDQHALHITYVITAAQQRGAKAVEATPEGQAAWEEEVARYAERGRDYFVACTPGFFNAEGEFADNPWSIVNLRYNGGPHRFYPMLADWQAEGHLVGTRFTGVDDQDGE